MTVLISIIVKKLPSGSTIPLGSFDYLKICLLKLRKSGKEIRYEI